MLMIQRIQSLYIIFYITIKIFLLYISFIKKSFFNFFIEGIDLFLIELVMLLIISVFLLFSFKNRKNQIKLLYFLILNQLIVLTAISILAFKKNTTIVFLLNHETFLYLLGFALLLLSFRGIKKDQKLIDSIDRIR